MCGHTAGQGRGRSLTALRGRAAALWGLHLPTHSEKGTLLLLPHREAGAPQSRPDSELHTLLMRRKRRQKLQERGESAGLAAEPVRGYLLSGLSCSSDCTPPSGHPQQPRAGRTRLHDITTRQPPGVAESGRSSENLATMLCPLRTFLHATPQLQRALCATSRVQHLQSTARKTTGQELERLPR